MAISYRIDAYFLIFGQSTDIEFIFVFVRWPSLGGKLNYFRFASDLMAICLSITRFEFTHIHGVARHSLCVIQFECVPYFMLAYINQSFLRFANKQKEDERLKKGKIEIKSLSLAKGLTSMRIIFHFSIKPHRAQIRRYQTMVAKMSFDDGSIFKQSVGAQCIQGETDSSTILHTNNNIKIKKYFTPFALSLFFFLLLPFLSPPIRNETASAVCATKKNK